MRLDVNWCENMIQQKIPIMFREPLALICHGIIAFGPLALGGYFVNIPSEFIFVILPGLLWIIVFQKLLLWRMDCFWNLKSRQNRTNKPENPDNLREFKTIKGWLFWEFLGRDIEHEGRRE